MKGFIVIILLFPISGCLTVDTKCCDHISTKSISKGLYLEKYRTFCAGVFGELTQCYLTDSTSFRENIGSYDEHDFFRVNLDGDSIKAYNLQTRYISDTAETKTLGEIELLKYHHTDSNCLSTVPLFGKNTIKCDNDFYPASSYKTEDGNYLAQVQFKCGSDYSNAVFYTDSLKFSLLIGIHDPGSWNNNFSVVKGNNDFTFYIVTTRRLVDTVQSKAYHLKNLKKGKMIKVCAKKAETK